MGYPQALAFFPQACGKKAKALLVFCLSLRDLEKTCQRQVFSRLHAIGRI